MDYRLGIFGVLDTDGLKNAPAFLQDGGIERRYREPYYFDNRKRSSYGGYLIQYTLSGYGIYEKDGIRHEITAGKGFAVHFPEESLYYLPEEQADPWVFFYLHFCGEGAAPYMDRLEQETGGVFELDEPSEAVKIFLRLQERMCGGGRLKRYESSEVVFRFLCTLLREIEEKRVKAEDSVVQRAADCMEREYASLESVEQLAERLEVSHGHLCRSFRKERKLTPMQYLTNVRIQAAMTELLNTEAPLEVVAGRCGFSNGNYFGKVFKKQVGMTPAQYRSMN